LESKNLGFKVFKTAESNFTIWRTREFASGEELQTALEDHIKEVKQATPENKLYEILIKAGYDLNTRIELKNVSKETPSKAKESPLKQGGDYYVVYQFSKESPSKAMDGPLKIDEESPLKTLIVCLSEYMDKSIVDAIIAENPKQVICLDSAFDGKDELKVNMYLALRDKKIEFSVV
jgi:adenine-specific DNA-methyltransferase